MTIEGWAVWEAGQACLRVDFGGISLDMGGALALAGALGAPAAIAAALLTAFQIGMATGQAERREDAENNRER